MEIESIIRRIGGTVIHIGEAMYHFHERADGAHVAEVEDQDHVDRLLGIREGFRVARDLKAGVAIPPKIIPQTQRTTPPAEAPKVQEPAKPVDQTQGAEGDGQTEDGDDAGEDEGDDEGDADTSDESDASDEGDETEETEETEQSGDDLTTLNREALAAKYAEKFGAPPPANVSKKSLIAALSQDTGAK